jgi:ABC-type multidrug transport system ATPase subunit
VEQTIKDLGLDGVKNLQIGKPEKKILSGGQRKRVNIALELVTDPVLVFLDEPTSGLAADDTTALVTLLSDLVKATGKTIIMTIHQPAKDEFEKFTHCLVMGYGGVPMYFGPTTRTRTASSAPGRSASASRTTSTTRATCSTCSPCASGPSTTPCARRIRTRSAEWRAGRRPRVAQRVLRRPEHDVPAMYSGRRAIGTGQGQPRHSPARPQTTGQLRLLSRAISR